MLQLDTEFGDAGHGTHVKLENDDFTGRQNRQYRNNETKPYDRSTDTSELNGRLHVVPPQSAIGLTAGEAAEARSAMPVPTREFLHLPRARSRIGKIVDRHRAVASL